jgi:hypothetical protein
MKLTREQLAQREWLYCEEVGSAFSIRPEAAIDLCERHGAYRVGTRARLPTKKLADLALDLTRESVGFRQAISLGLVRRCDKWRRYLVSRQTQCNHCSALQPDVTRDEGALKTYTTEDEKEMMRIVREEHVSPYFAAQRVGIPPGSSGKIAKKYGYCPEEPKEEKPVIEATRTQPKESAPTEQPPAGPAKADERLSVAGCLSGLTAVLADLRRDVDGLHLSLARLERREAGTGDQKEVAAKLLAAILFLPGKDGSHRLCDPLLLCLPPRLRTEPVDAR